MKTSEEPTICTCVALETVPKSVPLVVPVMPRPGRSCGSRHKSGTRAGAKIEPADDVAGTDSEMTIRSAPSASPASNALSAATTASKPRVSSRAFRARSPGLRSVLPTTISTSFTVSQRTAASKKVHA